MRRRIECVEQGSREAIFADPRQSLNQAVAGVSAGSPAGDIDVHKALQRFLRELKDQQRVLLAIDDVHLADAESLELFTLALELSSRVLDTCLRSHLIDPELLRADAR